MYRVRFEDVALLAEGVGRNWAVPPDPSAGALSPSSRRAWVEMRKTRSKSALRIVALLAEGVGRNQAQRTACKSRKVALLAEGVGRNPRKSAGISGYIIGSPSSRRAWVEIALAVPCIGVGNVALLAEGVGRNSACLAPAPCTAAGSPSSRRAWVEMQRPRRI